MNSTIEVEEKDFSALKRWMAKAKSFLGFSVRNDRFGLFVNVNIILYWLAVGLGILKLFGVI